MKFRIFFSFLALFIGAWIVFFKPFEVSLQKVSDSHISFEKFAFRQLSPQGVELQVRGSKAVALGDRLLFFDVVVQKEDLNLKAKEANYTNDTVELNENIVLKTKEYTLHTDKARYYLKAGIIQIRSPFELKAENLWARGQRGEVYIKERRIKAYKIKAKVKI